MDSREFSLNVDYLGSSGTILSCEQKAALQTSLVILKNNYKFNRLYFWGKILGIKDDYFIVQGITNDELGDRKTLYSKDCMTWGLLQPPTEEMAKKNKFAKGRFTGDPSFEFEHIEIKKTGEGESAIETEESIIIKEEERLSVVVADIDRDVRIAPRGAFTKMTDGTVTQNRTWEGLSAADAGRLSNYLHLRTPERINEKSLLQRAEMNKALDFLDPVDADVPRGAIWSVQAERGTGLVTLRSLLWDGYTFYHVPGTRNFGAVYAGSGTKNSDLPFML